MGNLTVRAKLLSCTIVRLEPWYDFVLRSVKSAPSARSVAPAEKEKAKPKKGGAKRPQKKGKN